MRGRCRFITQTDPDRNSRAGAMWCPVKPSAPTRDVPNTAIIVRMQRSGGFTLTLSAARIRPRVTSPLRGPRRLTGATSRRGLALLCGCQQDAMICRQAEQLMSKQKGLPSVVGGVKDSLRGESWDCSLYHLDVGEPRLNWVTVLAHVNDGFVVSLFYQVFKKMKN